ncbi:MAG: hypothetical protein FWG25_00780 [Promicromonosporaceae bacterium]|nr:hypothetical protein [Promicromonosporaceae bacterium]
MGYETEFSGELEPTRVITYEEREQIANLHGWDEDFNRLDVEFRTPATIAAGMPEYGHSPWRINDDGNLICQNGSSTDYIQWLKYLIPAVFPDNPLNGTIEWEGSSWGDRGAIDVTDNLVRVGHSEIIYDDVANHERTALYDRISAMLTNWEENRDSVTKFDFYDVLVDVQNYLAV